MLQHDITVMNALAQKDQDKRTSLNSSLASHFIRFMAVKYQRVRVFRSSSFIDLPLLV